MKIAISAMGPTLNDQVEARFGRTPYYMFIDTDTMDYQAVKNPNVAAGGGAGIQSAQLMADHEVRYVLTGNCGPNAFQVFSAAGIQVIVGVTGTVRQAVEQFNSGAIAAAAQPNVASHFGMGMSGGSGRGMGQSGGSGRGMGQGGGSGRGMGMSGGGGRGMGMGGGRIVTQGSSTLEPDVDQAAKYMQGSGNPGTQSQITKEEELAFLKEQRRVLEKQIRDAEGRIDQAQRSRGRVVARVNVQMCDGCGMCSDVCPAEAITVSNVAVIDADKCIGCEACVSECPRGAISMS